MRFNRAFAFLIVMLFMIMHSFALAAYEPKEFTETPVMNHESHFTFKIPAGWDTKYYPDDPLRHDYFDGNATKKDHGIMVVFNKNYGGRIYNTLEHANEQLLDLAKRSKYKEDQYELFLVDGCPAMRSTSTETFVSVKNTYVHRVTVLGKTSSLEIVFSTRSKDHDLQAAEFEKLLATITVLDKPATAFFNEMPDFSSFFDQALSFEEAKAELEKMCATEFQESSDVPGEGTHFLEPLNPYDRINFFDEIWEIDLDKRKDGYLSLNATAMFTAPSESGDMEIEHIGSVFQAVKSQLGEPTVIEYGTEDAQREFKEWSEPGGKQTYEQFKQLLEQMEDMDLTIFYRFEPHYGADNTYLGIQRFSKNRDLDPMFDQYRTFLMLEFFNDVD